jgi:hypothetical protein
MQTAHVSLIPKPGLIKFSGAKYRLQIMTELVTSINGFWLSIEIIAINDHNMGKNNPLVALEPFTKLGFWHPWPRAQNWLWCYLIYDFDSMTLLLRELFE